MRQKLESQPGSAEYDRDLANCLLAESLEDGTTLGVTDSESCARALRYHAGRHARRLALAAGELVFAAIGAVGLPDRSGDGRVDFGDLTASALSIQSHNPKKD